MPRLSRLGYIDARRTAGPVRDRVRSRGVPPALVGHEVFYTDDDREAERLIGCALGPARLRLRHPDTSGSSASSGSSGFAASLHGVRLRDVSLLYLDLHVAAELDVAECGPYYAIHMPMNGSVTGRVNGVPFEANTIRALVTNPGDRLELRLDRDSPELIVRIERDALERHLTRLIGRTLGDPLAFAPTFDLTTEAAMRWHGAVQLLHTEVFYDGSLLQDGRGIGSLEDFVMSTALLVQDSKYREALGLPARPTGRRTVRRALDYFERHLSEPITMSELAAHVGGSVRSIQQGFQEELGVTPMAYMRDRRLERARQELADAQPGDGVTVTGVAERWGFTHLSGFAMLYRKRWGESPSKTLRT